MTRFSWTGLPSIIERVEIAWAGIADHITGIGHTSFD